MDLEKIRNLPLEEQIEELEKLKQEFADERERLKQTIRDFERSLKEKEAHARNLVASSREHSEAEISIIVGSVKRVKNELELKNKELLFLTHAIKQAAELIEGDLDEVQERDARRSLQLIIEQLLLKDQEQRREGVQHLQELFDRTSQEREQKNKGKDSKKKGSDLENILETTETSDAAKKHASRVVDYSKQGMEEGPKTVYAAFNEEKQDNPYLSKEDVEAQSPYRTRNDESTTVYHAAEKERRRVASEEGVSMHEEQHFKSVEDEEAEKHKLYRHKD